MSHYLQRQRKASTDKLWEMVKDAWNGKPPEAKGLSLKRFLALASITYGFDPDKTTQYLTEFRDADRVVIDEGADLLMVAE